MTTKKTIPCGAAPGSASRSTLQGERRRVALYYPWVYLTSGAERAILELTGRSRHQWTIFTSHYDRDATFPEFANRDVVVLDDVSVRRSVRAVARGALSIATMKLPLAEYDALVVVCEGLGDLVVFRNHGIPAICICLTPLRIAFDEYYRERSMQSSSLARRTVIELGSRLFRVVDRMAWARYSRVFCISDEVRRRAIRGGLARETGRLELLHPGLGFEPGEGAAELEKFFLIPGRVMWTKNIELGIDAFRLFRDRHPEHRDFRLVIAGIVDDKSKPYFESLRERAREIPEIIFLVRPTDTELESLYRRCYGVLFTAFNEDWGIVPLEAMAFGKPVVSVNRGGPRESIDHGVTGYLEEPDEQAFAARMKELADSPVLAREVGLRGREAVRRYSWDSFTSRIDTAIDSVHRALQPHRGIADQSRGRELGKGHS